MACATGTTSGFVSRSGPAILYQQATADAIALETAVAKDANVSAVLLGLMRKLLGEMPHMGTGPSFEGLPTVTDDASLIDLLAITLWCRGTLSAFLTPDEIREQTTGRSFGLRPT